MTTRKSRFEAVCDCVRRFHMMLVAYNFNNWPDLTTIFHAAKQCGIGVVAMKTLKGAKATVLKSATTH